MLRQSLNEINLWTALHCKNIMHIQKSYIKNENERLIFAFFTHAFFSIAPTILLFVCIKNVWKSFYVDTMQTKLRLREVIFSLTNTTTINILYMKIDVCWNQWAQNAVIYTTPIFKNRYLMTIAKYSFSENLQSLHECILLNWCSFGQW